MYILNDSPPPVSVIVRITIRLRFPFSPGHLSPVLVRSTEHAASAGGFEGPKTDLTCAVALLLCVPEPDPRTQVAEEEETSLLPDLLSLSGAVLSPPFFSPSTHLSLSLRKLSYVNDVENLGLDRRPARAENGHARSHLLGLCAILSTAIAM